jgi:hypothetical protein
VGVGLATIGFSTTWRVIADRRGAGRGFGGVAQAAAIVSGLGFIGIAITPWDRVLDAHNAFVKVAFGVLLIFILCTLALQLRNGWPTVFVAVNVIYLIVLAIYVLVLFAGPGLGTESGLKFQVAAQKIIVYSSVLNIGLQAAGVRREARRAVGAPKPGTRRA